MADLILVLVAVVVVFLAVCTVYFIVCHFLPGHRHRIVESHERLYTTACVGAFICAGYVMTIGFSVVLFFIPSSWGYIDAEGDFQSLRWTIGGVLGLACSVTIVSGFARAYEARHEALVLRAQKELVELRGDIDAHREYQRPEWYELIRRFNEIVDMMPISWWPDCCGELRKAAMDIEELTGAKRADEQWKFKQ